MATRTVYACETCQPLLEGTVLPAARSMALAAAHPTKVRPLSCISLLECAGKAGGVHVNISVWPHIEMQQLHADCLLLSFGIGRPCLGLCRCSRWMVSSSSSNTTCQYMPIYAICIGPSAAIICHIHD